MRRSGSWMTIWDDRILEYMVQNQGTASVGQLTESGYIRVSNAQVSRRCTKLADHRLVRDLGNGVYAITERGETYLEGELDASEDAQDDPVEVTGEDSSSETEESNST